MKNEKRKVDRRNFFRNLGLGFGGITILTSIPYKIFAKTNRKRKKVNVQIHSSAVKRNR